MQTASMSTFFSSEPSVHLKQTQQWDKQFLGLAGFSCLVLFPLIVTSLARGEWGNILLFAAFPAGLVGVGRLFAYLIPQDYIVLYSDRMEFPCSHGKPRVVAWTEVKAVCWPKTHNPDAHIVISLPANSNWPLGAHVDLQSISPTDRLMLIRYLFLASTNMEQKGWPQFCRKRAVPLVETLCQMERLNSSEVQESPLVARIRRISEFVSRHPFLEGVGLPLVILWGLPRVVSRRMWWIMAAILAISAVVNIRLVWGCWASPFTSIVIGFSAGCFGLGLLAQADRRLRNGEEELSSLGAILSFALTLIGFPLLANAIVLGWVRIPKVLANALPLVFLVVLLSPMIIHNLRRNRREKQQASALEADAIRRWEAYVTSGNLPEANPDL